MNDLEFNELLEAASRRKLSVVEEAELQRHLALHPARQAEWESELALNHLLDQLPDAPLSSNFTSRVMLAIDVEDRWAARDRTPVWLTWVRSIRLGRATVVAALAVFGGIMTVQQYRLSLHSMEMTQDVIRFSKIRNVPSVDMLKDFDAINGLGQMQDKVDVEWLTALK